MYPYRNNKIQKHIREAEKPGISPRYYRAIQGVIDKLDKQISSELAKNSFRYRYIPVLINENHVSIDAYPERKGFVFTLLGILDIINRNNKQIVKEIYCCLEIVEDAGNVFWVDRNGRISDDKLNIKLAYIYNQLIDNENFKIQMLPNEGLIFKTRPKSEAETYFLEQSQQNANFIKTKEEKYYYNVISLGQTIIRLDDHSFPYISGTYANMANAEFVRFKFNNTYNPLDPHLQSAQKYIELAVQSDDSNQVALAAKFTINFYAFNFANAINALSNISTDGLCNFYIQNPTLFTDYILHLASQNDTLAIHDDLDKCLKVIRNKVQGNTKLYSLILSQCAQVYSTIYGDYVTAYSFVEDGLRNQEDDICFTSIYGFMCFICLCPPLQKYSEALRYARMAHKYVNDIEDIQEKAICHMYYGLALAENGYIEEGIQRCKDAALIYPDDTTFLNLARCYMLQKDYTQAIEWGRKALFLHNDETNQLLLANAYKSVRKYEDALLHFIKAFQLSKDTSYHTYSGMNGNKIHSFIDPYASKDAKAQSLSGIISTSLKLGRKNEAYAYLHIARELVPDQKEWDVFEDTIDIISLSEESVIKIKNELIAEKKDAEEQMRISKDMVLRLIKLQDSAQEFNLEEYSDWKRFDEQIGKIITKLEKEAHKNKKLVNEINRKFNKRFPNLSRNALHFLTTAEVLYEMNKNQEIDFACIIVEYCKVLETQLRVILGKRIPYDMKMLGQIVRLISDNNISPYCKYLQQMTIVNEMRKRSAHTGALTRSETETIRSIYFDEGLLDVLK